MPLFEAISWCIFAIIFNSTRVTYTYKPSIGKHALFQACIEKVDVVLHELIHGINGWFWAIVELLHEALPVRFDNLRSTEYRSCCTYTSMRALKIKQWRLQSSISSFELLWDQLAALFNVCQLPTSCCSRYRSEKRYLNKAWYLPIISSLEVSVVTLRNRSGKRSVCLLQVTDFPPLTALEEPRTYKQSSYWWQEKPGMGPSNRIAKK